MKFFIPEDFRDDAKVFEGDLYVKIAYAANKANEKLEREGKVVYGGSHFLGDKPHGIRFWYCSDFDNSHEDYKAILINIERIGEPCTHPLDQIRQTNWIEEAEGFNQGLRLKSLAFKCIRCGLAVQPKEFCDF